MITKYVTTYRVIQQFVTHSLNVTFSNTNNLNVNSAVTNFVHHLRDKFVLTNRKCKKIEEY